MVAYLTSAYVLRLSAENTGWKLELFSVKITNCLTDSLLYVISQYRY